MKISHPFSVQTRQGGVALVLVLGMLVLVAVLVVAFLSSVSTELQSAKSYASGSDARTLADSAVNIVISQIQDATSNAGLAWASQPGMIRTYDNSGQATSAFKLYSSGLLRINGGFDPVANQNAEVPADWAANPSLYTDLNKPVASGGRDHYPIINPAAAAKDESGGLPLDGGVEEPIEGCFLDTTNPAVAVSAKQANLLPMPVQWLYVLKDGTIAAMDPGTKRIAGAGATLPDGTANSIVGRIAFWADDESCKVNINTASEGTFWDRPWVAGNNAGYDFSMATKVPAQNEFQRYPGHPAMTCLSTIFPIHSNDNAVAYNERMYGIIPRVVGGGSTSGTVSIGNNSAAALVPDAQRLFASVDEFLFQGVTASPRKVNPDGPSSPLAEEELEKRRFFLTANSRAPEVNLFNKPRVTLWPLQANTADVDNPSEAIDRNAKDKLIAFCSTIGNKPYYFQRFNTTSASQPSSQSPVMDWDMIPRNQELFVYLRSLTDATVPGLGGSVINKYPNSRDQILTEMFDFVRSSVNTLPATGAGSYSYTLWGGAVSGSNPKGFITGQSQIAPLVIPKGTALPGGGTLPYTTKGFGRFPTITQAAMIFYRQDELDVSQTTDASGNITYTVTEKPGPYHMGAVLILQPFNPTPGPPAWSSNVRYRILGLDGLAITDGSTGVKAPMGFPSSPSNLITGIDGEHNQTALAGLEQCTQYLSPVTNPFTNTKTLGTADPEKNYPFFTAPIQLTGKTFHLSGSNADGSQDIIIEIYAGKSDKLVQTIKMNIPPVNGLPLPTVSFSTSNNGKPNAAHSNNNQYTDFDNRFSRVVNQSVKNGRYGILEDGQHRPLPLILGTDVVRSVEPRFGGPAKGDFRLFAGLNEVPDSFFEGRGLKDAQTAGNGYKYTDVPANINDAKARIHSLRIDGDGPSADTGSSNGFYAGYGATGDPRGKLVKDASYRDPNRGNTSRASKIPVAPRALEGAFMENGRPGDWDTGPGSQGDGPYINKADEGTSNKTQASSSNYYALGGYINALGIVESGASFAPNRQISSGVAFGSLPTGIQPGNPDNSKPWQTLLFCKNPAAGKNHPGFGVPADAPPYSTVPDHAFLDLFTMPIVEPYAISEPFSTAGKVNMNYQIAPFTYLTRNTAVRSVLKSTKMMAIPTSDAQIYKYNSSNNTPNYRYSINPDEKNGTLRGFEERFTAGDIFRSASEVCNVHLVPGNLVDSGVSAPGNPSYGTMENWWDDYELTGDNVREGPYGHIYPRLTTKSNTFTVHVKAQSLKKSKNTADDEFVEGRDQVTGEFRGSFIIQRTLDPNSDSLVKMDSSGKWTAASELDPDAMVGPYKFRVIGSKRFAP